MCSSDLHGRRLGIPLVSLVVLYACMHSATCHIWCQRLFSPIRAGRPEIAILAWKGSRRRTMTGTGRGHGVPRPGLSRILSRRTKCDNAGDSRKLASHPPTPCQPRQWPDQPPAPTASLPTRDRLCGNRRLAPAALPCHARTVRRRESLGQLRSVEIQASPPGAA